MGLPRRNKDLENDVSKIVRNVFRSGRLILGKSVQDFEKNFSNWNEVKFGVGVGNGTDAIKLALMATGIKAGDEVITTSNTAVPTAFTETGAIPVFCDVYESTYNINIELIESLITKKSVYCGSSFVWSPHKIN